MKHRIGAGLLSFTLAVSIFFFTQTDAVRAEENVHFGKYVDEVYIAYGRTEDAAENWLIAHGYEPVEGNLNEGKCAQSDNREETAAVMGIRRTNDARNAVTDMAVMNMGTDGIRSYSFRGYEQLVSAHRIQISAFLDRFIPMLQEYRRNYSGDGSSGGKARAELAHKLLNRFYDGETDGTYAVYDTGIPLGDLLLNPTRQELGEEKYAYLSGSEQLRHGDLQQIALESSGTALLAIETALLLASDTEEENYIERLAEKKTNLSEQQYADAAERMAANYSDIRQDIQQHTAYCDAHDLWQTENEGDEAYSIRLSAYFRELEEKAPDTARLERQTFAHVDSLCAVLSRTPYTGAWGDTLLEFFDPQDGRDYGTDSAYFLPLAAALSEGQRAGLEFVHLRSLLLLGAGTAETAENALSELRELFSERMSISVYTGISRSAFRNGIALTNETRMWQNMGAGDPFGVLQSSSAYMMCYAALGIDAALQAGKTFADRSLFSAEELPESEINRELITQIQLCAQYEEKDTPFNQLEKADAGALKAQSAAAWRIMGRSAAKGRFLQQMRAENRCLSGIGGALMLDAAGEQLCTYDNRTFTPIPLYAVDTALIVSAGTDEGGEKKENVTFDRYVHYQAVKCNRQEAGDRDSWQDGVDAYTAWGCGDAADLNCDMGKQWLALYTARSAAVGEPILAESLTVQTGSDIMPGNCTRNLHFFSDSRAADLADESYCYSSMDKGMYLFWATDEKAYTGSVFSSGQLGLAGACGLFIGVIGATILMMTGNHRKATDAEEI